MKRLTTDHIAKIKPYEPGKPPLEVMREYGLTECIKLASNENPLGPSPMAIEAASKVLGEVARYPDSSGFYLTNRLAEIHGIPSDRIVLGNGSVEIIEMIARAFLGPGEDGLMSQYAFLMYRLAIQCQNGRCVTIPARELGHDLDAIAAAVDDKTKVIYLANPNNPTGTMFSKKALEVFLDRLPGEVVVVLDEAYHEYIKDTAYPDGIEFLKRGRDLIVLRTFSKIYGLAGLRIGYACGPKRLVEAIKKVRPPFNTSSVAQAAALAALDDEEHVERSYRANLREREYLVSRFTDLGLRFHPSVANFLLVDFQRPAGEMFDLLLRRGVILRPMIPYHLKSSMRVTVGTREENDRLIDVLSDFKKSGDI